MIFIQGLPFPPTMNHRMIPARGRLILSPEHRAYKALLNLFLIRKVGPANHAGLIGKKLEVTIIYEGPSSQWFTKKGEIKRCDVENRHKALIDGIMPFFVLDDSQIFEITIKKIARDCLSETTASVCVEEMA